MRNFKKVLSLVLCMAMMLSVMVMGTGATSLGDYTDKDQVTDKYAVAVDVVTQLGVLEGVGKDTFAPQMTLSRAQMATMIYRMYTGDVDKEYVANFVDGANKFTDTPVDAWYAGYVGYAADAAFLKGCGDGTYQPNADLTGYAAAAVLLRGMGYTADGHNFTGADWTVEVAKVALDKGLFAGLGGVEMGKALTREQTAQLLYNALFAECVEYTHILGYQPAGYSLAEKVFGIVSPKAGEDAVGSFGRPVTAWFDADDNAIIEIPDEVLATYNVATKGCDIIADTGVEAGLKVAYLNGEPIVGFSLKDDNTLYGAQGRVMEVYADTIVFIDTFLAEVTAVNDAVLDKNGHEKSPASIDLQVWDNGDNTVTNYAAVEVTDFDAGDMVLVTIDAGDIYSVANAESTQGVLTKIAGANKFTHDIQDVQAINSEAATVNVTADLEAASPMKLAEAYNFFYDSFGNVIGAEKIPAQYAVVDKLYRETVKGDATLQATLVGFDGEKFDVQLHVTDSLLNLVKIAAVELISENAVTNQLAYYNVAEYSFLGNGEATLEFDGFDRALAAGYEAGNFYINSFIDPDWDKLFNMSFEDLLAAVIEAYDDGTLSTFNWFSIINWADLDKNLLDKLQLNDDTQILLQTSQAPDANYLAFTGYEELPSFVGGLVQYKDLDDDGYVDLVYILGATLSSRTVFIYDTQPVSTSVSEKEGWYINEMKALEMQDGELVDTTIDILYFDVWHNWQNILINQVGLYNLVELDDYGYFYAVNTVPNYTVNKLTTDGLRAEVGLIGQALNQDVNLKGAEVVKYEGSFQEGTVSTDWTAKDLDNESTVYLQYNEKGEVIAVYDMWYVMQVAFNPFGDQDPYADASFDAPTVYWGKTLSAPITVNVPAYVNLAEVETIHEYPLGVLMENYTEFTWDEVEDQDVCAKCESASDKHAVASSIEVNVLDQKSTSVSIPEYLYNTYSDRIYGDIMITLVADPKHDNDSATDPDCFGLTADAPDTYRNIEDVTIDVQADKGTTGEITIWVKNLAAATVMTSDVDMWLTIDCPFSQGYVYYDNTEANLYDTTQAIIDNGTANNIYLKLTAEDGSSAIYKFYIKQLP